MKENIFLKGWGMVDGMHAVVFVDNHDNQVIIIIIIIITIMITEAEEC